MKKTSASILKAYLQNLRHSKPGKNVLGGWGDVFGGPQDPATVTKSIVKLNDLISKFQNDVQLADLDVNEYTPYISRMRDVIGGCITTPTASWDGHNGSISGDILHSLYLTSTIFEAKGIAIEVDEEEADKCINLIDEIMIEINRTLLDASIKSSIRAKLNALKEAVSDFLHFGDNEIFKEVFNVFVFQTAYKDLLISSGHEELFEKISVAVKKSLSVAKSTNDIAKFLENAGRVLPSLIQMIS